MPMQRGKITLLKQNYNQPPTIIRLNVNKAHQGPDLGVISQRSSGMGTRMVGVSIYCCRGAGRSGCMGGALRLMERDRAASQAAPPAGSSSFSFKVGYVKTTTATKEWQQQKNCCCCCFNFYSFVH